MRRFDLHLGNIAFILGGSRTIVFNGLTINLSNIKQLK
jgi:hypothetical protein